VTSDQLVHEIAELAADKKALDIAQLDMRGVVDYTDYLLICSGASDRQVKAIADGIRFGLKDAEGVGPQRVEGLAQARWVLLDYLDVVVHIFVPEVREFYGLERLWGEVPLRAPLRAPALPASSPA
jgi:ribosome-associated protein